MTESEFKEYLVNLGIDIESGKASVALVAVRGNDINIAAAGNDATEAMMHLMLVAATQQTTPDNVTLN